MIKLIITIIIIAVIFFGFSVFGFGKNISNDSAGSVPGDILYFLDKSLEWLELNILATSEDKKIKLEIKFINERLAELQKLQEKKELTQKKAQKLMDDYNKLADKMESDIKKAKEAKKDVGEFMDKIEKLIKKHQMVIEKISESTPKKTSNLIDEISNWGQGAYNKLKNISE
jgi:DNA anti-recombination protein RmuC